MKILIICGYYTNGLEDCKRKKIDYKTYDKIYGFEASPLFDKQKEYSLINKNYKDRVVLINKIVSDTDGYITYYQRKNWGSSGIIKEKMTGGNILKTLLIESIDFSKFIQKIWDDNISKTMNGPIIHLTMNIEGAEFDIIDKMIIDNTISKIALFHLEFHLNIKNKKTEYKERYNKYMTYLKKLFILKRPWYSGCPEDWVLYKKNTI